MKKNIMLLIGQLVNGGAERSITNVANELSKYHNVVLVAANAKKIDYPCNVEIIEIPNLLSRRKRILGLFKLRKLKKKYKIDITISYTTAYNFYNVITKYKDKTYISIRNHLSTKKEEPRFVRMHKISIKLANKIICCSKSVLKDQLDNYHAKSEKLCVIENFCNSELIEKSIKQKFTKEEKELVKGDYVITMARLVPHKGQYHIIKAMSLVVAEKPNTKLLIFGRGNMKDELIELSKSYNLEKNVIFMDFNSTPYNFVHNAKALILASDFEGFPNVIIEAMTCATPVIATNSPGGSEEILCKNPKLTYNSKSLKMADYGILIPNFINEHNEKEITKNEIILKDAILELINNKDTYQKYKEKSLDRIKEFSKDKIIKKWLDIIENK